MSQKELKVISISDLVEEVVNSVGQIVAARQDYQIDCLTIFHTLGMNICGHLAYRKGKHGQGKFFEELARAVAERQGKRIVSSRYLHMAAQFYEKFPQVSNALQTFKDRGLPPSIHSVALILPSPKEVKTLPLPKGKYQVIYADPPWAYDVDLSSGATRSPENNYPVMNLEKIKEFGNKIQEISAENCILFLWITAPKFNWLFETLESWGFDYKTNLIWDKVKPNLGHYSSVRHEILVIAGKGKCAPTCDGKTIQSIDSVQSIEKSPKHSAKPEKFYEIIEILYPNSKKIELFARNKRKGWDSWGNEV